MNEQRDLFAARARRDLGIERSGAHADREAAAWRVRAGRLIGEYGRLGANGKPFLVEDATPYVVSKGVEPPPDGRAWGAATMYAKRNGLIRSCGYAPAKSSNLSPKVLWIAV